MQNQNIGPSVERLLSSRGLKGELKGSSLFLNGHVFLAGSMWSVKTDTEEPQAFVQACNSLKGELKKEEKKKTSIFLALKQ